ncbi:MAG: energy-coupling factor transporter transmembrane component T [Clostridia bacterium]|nr:energy-coupling factor transporter transmembrane component T [Clostridia bacterium]
MLSDITIGQFFPGKSIIHRLDPRVKLSLLLAFIIFIFATFNYFSLLLMVFSVFAIVLMTKIPVKLYFKSLKSIIVIVIFTSIINLFYGKGEPIWQWGIIKLTVGGINNAVFVLLRIVSLILVSTVLTYTTSPTQLTDAMENLMSPLKVLKFPVHEVAMMMTIALRFIPTLLDETEKIINAQKARGASMDTGNIIQRIKAFLPVLVPLLVSSFRRAYELATAMECRCYHGGEGRTRMKSFHLSKLDYISLSICAILFAGVILGNILLPAPIK